MSHLRCSIARFFLNESFSAAKLKHPRHTPKKKSAKQRAIVTTSIPWEVVRTARGSAKPAFTQSQKGRCPSFYTRPHLASPAENAQQQTQLRAQALARATTCGRRQEEKKKGTPLSALADRPACNRAKTKLQNTKKTQNNKPREPTANKLDGSVGLRSSLTILLVMAMCVSPLPSELGGTTAPPLRTTCPANGGNKKYKPPGEINR